VELRYLLYFATVAEQQSFTRAAQRLHVAQSAISQQIKTLEEELEVKLLLRNKRSVKLTAAGHAFLREAKDILNRVEQSRVEARRAARGETGTLSIGCFGGATSHFLPELIHTYRRRYPAVRVHVYERSLGEQLDALEVGRIDIGFTTPLGKKDLKRFVQETVFSGCVLAALPDGHSLAEFQKISLAKLADEDWVLLRRSVASEIVDALMLPCAKAGFSPRVISEPDGLQTVLAMVAAGVGVSIVPSCVRSLEQPGVTFIPIQPNPPPIGMVAAYPKGEPSPAVAAFLDMLRQQLPQIRSKYVDTYETLSFVAGSARL
jgi:DNA-binding transcriptional LysR family regulator